MKVWGKYNFEWAAQIRPQLDNAGAVQTFQPAADYPNPQGLALHRYGQGPFCKFRITGDRAEAGVYAITSSNKLMYVGECTNLATRFNNGYGSISPRACYEGGQPAYCRINQLIYEALKSNQNVEVWFSRATNRQEIVADLIKTLKPVWNRRDTSAKPA